MTAAEVRSALYARHFASSNQMPGAWTCIEEWRNIDLLAFSAWRSQGNYARVGYEVKVSRSDLRSELLNPHKRAANVAWCNEFYLAVPKGLLTAEEIAYAEPEWDDADWSGERCPGIAGVRCASGWPRRRKTHFVRVPIPSAGWANRHEQIVCPTCDGKGAVSKSRVEIEAPTCWVPRDVGLVEICGRGTSLVKKSPRRKEVPALTAAELGQFARFVSMRPDPRHAPRRDQHVAAYERAEQLTLGAA